MVDIDLEELAATIELLDKTELSQFRSNKGDLRIAVTRDGAPLDGDRTAAGAERLLPQVSIVRAKTTLAGSARLTELRKGESHRLPSLLFPSLAPLPVVVKK